MAVSYMLRKYGGAHFCIADPLYDILEFAKLEFGFGYNEEADTSFLNWVGKKWVRAQGEDILINRAIDEIRRFEWEQPTTNIFVSTIKFDNEVSALRNEGFGMVRYIPSVFPPLPSPPLPRSLLSLRSVGQSASQPASLPEVESVWWDYEVQNTDYSERPTAGAREQLRATTPDACRQLDAIVTEEQTKPQRQLARKLNDEISPGVSEYAMSTSL